MEVAMTDLNRAALEVEHTEPDAHPLAAYKLSRAVRKDVLGRFTYHPPIGDQPARYEELRDIALGYAITICQLCPENRERSLALTHLEQAVMYANAAIARGEK
jgi:hypothetical protein